MHQTKKVLLVATGGTIASKKTENGLTPGITPEELLGYVPDAGEYCRIDTIQLFNLDSTNISPEHWKLIVGCIRENYDSYDGFVIAHGTDTMAYTAAALSYMIQDSAKPIVLTGAQKPINLDITDAKTNLLDSIMYAADDASEGVSIVFGGKVIAGTRAKKVRSKSYNAFSSIDFPELAVIQDKRLIRYIPGAKGSKQVKFYDNLQDNIFLLKLIPGIKADILEYVFEKYDAIIVESFGVGGIPITIREKFFALCQKYQGKMIIMATQVAHEGSDMTVYEVGHDMKASCNFLESYDMTLESVIAKTMWLLANCTDDASSREKLFYTCINHDILFTGANQR